MCSGAITCGTTQRDRAVHAVQARPLLHEVIEVFGSALERLQYFQKQVLHQAIFRSTQATPRILQRNPDTFSHAGSTGVLSTHCKPRQRSEAAPSLF